MPSRTMLKSAAIAERSAALPKIPQEMLDQFEQGPMTAEAIQDATMALKKALIERALAGESSATIWATHPEATSLLKRATTAMAAPARQS